MRIGIECGGTFTDLVVVDDQGGIVATNKVFSTPDDPSRAVISALEALSPEHRDGADLLHGSTVATNALLERKGGPVGLVTTAGFRDVIYLQRQDRATMYDLAYVKPRPLVERRHVFEVRERTTPSGAVLIRLDEESVRVVARRLVEEGVESVAVSLLHSYANPDHEIRVAELLREAGVTVPISLSHEVSREFREYERTTTTTVEAFIRPRVSTYVARLQESISSLGLRSLLVMQSNGGIVPPESVIDRPVTMLLSGPAAGVAGAVTIGTRAGLDEIVTMDMGGTSTDVAFIRQAEPELKSETWIDGLPLRVPLIDIHTVGAGGGSIVRIDSGGLLTVGPDSAGAEPGPACYGKGGTLPTITDANVITGVIPAGTKLAGRFDLDVQAATSAFEPLARELGTSVEVVASDAIRLANVAMAGAIREVSLERGHELDAATVVAYGGAGALHAASVAEETGISRVIVPPYSGLTSAYGLLTAAFRRDFSRTWFRDDVASLTIDEIAEEMDALLAGSVREVAEQGIPVDDLRVSWHGDMRYRGQGFEIPVPLDLGETGDGTAISARFHETHARQFGHSSTSRAVQLVTLRLRLTSPAPELDPPRTPRVSGEPRNSTVVVAGAPLDAVIVERGALASSADLTGPAIVTDASATTFVPPGWTATLDTWDNLVLERRAR
ncbi:hydantoinase/oxoprolinase family protein [Herbiconiux sp. YIM B11900]|uniref:hydantoinase/oxoprolinase family protein n=1 Tax=Herbiconiux sp. YIM B11900 TaxID=3404131 RepID=UPI003F8377EB